MLIDLRNKETGIFNNQECEVYDISTEEYRIYHSPAGDTVILEQPIELHVFDYSEYRILTKDGVGYYILGRWVHLELLPKLPILLAVIRGGLVYGLWMTLLQPFFIFNTRIFPASVRM